MCTTIFSSIFFVILRYFYMQVFSTPWDNDYEGNSSQVIMDRSIQIFAGYPYFLNFSILNFPAILDQAILSYLSLKSGNPRFYVFHCSDLQLNLKLINLSKFPLFHIKVISLEAIRISFNFCSLLNGMFIYLQYWFIRRWMWEI